MTLFHAGIGCVTKDADPIRPLGRAGAGGLFDGDIFDGDSFDSGIFDGAGYHFTTVARIDDAGVAPVYSLRVDTDDHAFITNGFVSHNTECRMDRSAMALVEELGENTVDFVPNYDGTETEPDVLPASFPNLLVNGSSGIAVGMATNMAPHNLGEIVGACKALLANPGADLDELMTHVKGPDFPTGGTVVGAAGVREAYATGRGSFRVRATAEITDVSARRRGIIVTELPYMIGPEKVIAKIKELINMKKLLGVASVKDLSDRKVGLRLVIECKTGFNPAAVLEELYRTTPLEEGFAINNVALVKGKPETLGLKQLCEVYLEHRLEVIVRRTQYRKDKAEARAHVLEGLMIALASIEEVVKIIRSSKDTEIARTKLQKQFKLSEVQAVHILDMPLRRLTSLEVNKLKAELHELRSQIAELVKILASTKVQHEMAANELDLAVDSFGSPRRSRLLDVAPEPGAGATAGLEIPDDPCVVWLAADGSVARSTPVGGGRAAKATKADLIVASVETTNRATLNAVTNRGRWLSVAAVEIPDVSAQRGTKARGGPAVEFFDLASGETIIGLFGAVTPGGPGLALATRSGVVKRLTAGGLPTRTGLDVIGLKNGDVVVGAVALLGEGDDLVLVSSAGQLLRTPAAGVRPQGRTAGGVAGMRLGADDAVLTLGVTREGDASVVFTVSDAGNAKSTLVVDYPVKGRGGAGVRAQTFKRGEATIVAARIGVGPLFGVGTNGGPVALPAATSKRDASGSALPEAVVALAYAVRNVT